MLLKITFLSNSEGRSQQYSRTKGTNDFLMQDLAALEIDPEVRLYDETQILEVGWGSSCRLVAFFSAFWFEEVTAMIFRKFYSNFCKMTFEVTLKSARQITVLSYSLSETFSTPKSALLAPKCAQ